ncbi:MAG: sigma-54 dependent transcriptional regulator, partial [Pseudomonadota bacterium]
MKNPVILLVDDEDSIVASLRGGLEDDGYIVITASDGMKALDIVKSNAVDMVFLDIWLPGMDGLEILKAIKEFDGAIEVVIMTGHGTVNTAVQAVKQGAFDFLEKPFSLDTVLDIIKKIKEKRQAVTVSDKTPGTPCEEAPVLTGETQSILIIKEQILRLASQKGHVLLQGETGTGKELVACLIHAASHRKSSPLTKFNCTYYAPDEFEIELFGIQKTTEAPGGKSGVLSDTAAGTVFLEAVDALPPKVQKQLGEFLSSPKQKASPVRIIASMLKNTDHLREEIKLHRTLLECFTHALILPPLRERRGDIPLLLNNFVTDFCREYGFREKILQDDALEILVNYDWPGNVKELK